MWQSLFDRDLSRRGRRRYFLIFTGLFLLFALWTFVPFLRNHRSLIRGNENFAEDGIKQHFTAMLYLGNWLRSIVRTLVTEHKLEFPLWDYHIGFGSDILTTLHYYGLGDPLKLLCAFVPIRYMEYYYSFLCLLYLYLAGITFSLYGMSRKFSKAGILLGSFCLMFSSFAIGYSILHPFLLYGIIFMPLLMIGADRILEGRSPRFFLFFVFYAGITNFYVLYWLAFGTAGYVTVRLFETGKAKRFGFYFVKFLFYGLCGVCMAALIFLPVIIAFLGAYRAQTRVETGLLYHFSYYRKLLMQLVSPGAYNGSTNAVSLTGTAFAAVMTLLGGKREKRPWRILFVVMTGMICLPAAASILNGFSYASGRWMWMYQLLCCLILTMQWEELLQMDRRQMAFALWGWTLYTAAMALCNLQVRKVSFWGSAFILAVILTSCCSRTRSTGKTGAVRVRLPAIALAGLTLLNVAVTARFQVRGSMMGEFVRQGKAISIAKSTEAEAVLLAKGEAGGDYLRTETYLPSLYNASELLKVPETCFYWSIANRSVTDYQIDLGINMATGGYSKYNGQDGREMLLALSNVGYYVTREEDLVPPPYGYRFLAQEEAALGKQYRVYQNEFAIPFGFTYRAALTEEEIEAMGLNPVQKQELMMEMAVAEGKTGAEETLSSVLSEGRRRLKNRTPSSGALPVNLSCGKYVTCREDGSFLAVKKNAELTLEVEGMQPGEEHALILKDVWIERMDDWELYQGNYTKKYNEDKYAQLPEERKEKILKLHRAYDRYNRHNNVFSIPVACGETKTSFRYETPRYIWYAGIHDFTVNLGIQENPDGRIVLTLPEKGIYRFGSVEIWHQPLGQLASQVEELKQAVLKDVSMKGNEIRGSILVDSPRLLYLAVSYDKGWRAFVDGKEVPVWQINKLGMGIAISEGSHEVVFRYRTRGLAAGAFLSLIGFIFFAAAQDPLTRTNHGSRFGRKMTQ